MTDSMNTYQAIEVFRELRDKSNTMKRKKTGVQRERRDLRSFEIS